MKTRRLHRNLDILIIRESLLQAQVAPQIRNQAVTTQIVAAFFLVLNTHLRKLYFALTQKHQKIKKVVIFSSTNFNFFSRSR